MTSLECDKSKSSDMCSRDCEECADESGRLVQKNKEEKKIIIQEEMSQEDVRKQVEDNEQVMEEDEDDPLGLKRTHDGRTGNAATGRPSAAWTPVKVRKERLKMDRSLAFHQKV